MVVGVVYLPAAVVGIFKTGYREFHNNQNNFIVNHYFIVRGLLVRSAIDCKHHRRNDKAVHWIGLHYHCVIYNSLKMLFQLNIRLIMRV